MYLSHRNQFAGDMRDPFAPRFWRTRWAEPLEQRRPSGIFTVNMGELFGDWVPETTQQLLFNVIKECPQHRFYLLTKQPQNLANLNPFPSNCWVGATATNTEQYKQALVGLRAVKAKVKYISFEPLLEYIPINPPYDLDDLNWVIIGGKSGKDKFYPPEEWIKEIEKAADKVRIPVFEKDNLREVLWTRNNLYGNYQIWYKYPRREMPGGM